ncbi:MAG TPA: OmpA family protein [Paenirhodobacter sp.]
MNRLAFLLCLLPLSAQADPFRLTLPDTASVTAQEASPATDYTLLTGRWTEQGGAATRLEGARDDRSWRLRGDHQTTLQLLAPLRAQIEAAGYTPIYECNTDDCGGFDFRYALKLLPEPQMHVDLGDFRYFAARNGTEWLALTVSRSSESGFVQLTALSQRDVTTAPAPEPTAPPPPTAAPEASDFTVRLEATGAVALDDLVFDSGATTLDARDYASLRGVADYLATRPKARIALVGHTDSIGTLDANIAVSRKRAEAVLARLVAAYGLRAEQLRAEGAGWLAPRATNLTTEGQDRNRRVEAVLLPDAG